MSKASNVPPDPEHRAKMGKAIKEAIASGSLLATGGLGKRATAAAHVTRKGGEVSVEDPPEGDGWMAAGGYSLAEYASKEAAIAMSLPGETDTVSSPIPSASPGRSARPP